MYLTRLKEPRRQAPYGGSGCSPQGVVAAMVSQYQRLFMRLIVSMNSTPGSAQSQVPRMICSQRERASTSRYTRPSKVSGKGSPVWTHSMNLSVTATETLKPVSLRVDWRDWISCDFSGPSG